MKILEQNYCNDNLIGLTAKLKAKQSGKSDLLLKAILEHPDERRYWEIPTQIELYLHYVENNQPLLARMTAGCMTAGYYGSAAPGVMDAYDADYGVVGFELFDERCEKYPAGNVVMFDFSGGAYPSNDLFADEFDMNALIDDIIKVCNKLMLDSKRKADYFVFYGNESMWPPDAQWKKKLRASGCDIIDYEWGGTFIAVSKAHRRK
jgi:hypothetical protein